MTTFEPGASDVLTHGLRVRPRARALRATQAGAEHHRRVRGVRAARDRGDHDVAVVELGLGAVGHRDRHAACGSGRATGVKPWFGSCCGASCPGSPRPAGRWPGSSPRPPRRASRARARSPRAPSRNALCAFDQRDAVLRAPRPGDRRHDVAEVERDGVAERRLLARARRARGPAPWRRPRSARSARPGGPVNSM